VCFYVSHRILCESVADEERPVSKHSGREMGSKEEENVHEDPAVQPSRQCSSEGCRLAVEGLDDVLHEGKYGKSVLQTRRK
jgi:hypothetical protein